MWDQLNRKRLSREPSPEQSLKFFCREAMGCTLVTNNRLLFTIWSPFFRTSFQDLKYRPLVIGIKDFYKEAFGFRFLGDFSTALSIVDTVIAWPDKSRLGREKQDITSEIEAQRFEDRDRGFLWVERMIRSLE